MKFLKAIQKTGVETSDSSETTDKDTVSIGAKISHIVPDLLSAQNVTIGRNQHSADVLSDSLKTPAGGVGGQPFSPASIPKSGATAEFYIDPTRLNPRLVAITQPNSAFAEEFRNLRTNILQKSQKRRLQTIAVVSVAPSEGKSITALNLAWLIAQTEGVSALLVDGDLRLPSLSDYLNIEPPHGLVDVLDGKATLSESIVRLRNSGLHLLSGGGVKPDVAEQISGTRFGGILDEARAKFDFVIIDAPPLSVFADAKVLINHADGALLVVRSNYTSYKVLDRIMEGLPKERMLGVVLNDTEETVISGNYYDYPYYRR
jgi:receptor protein-tyrosine kinase